MIKSVKLQTSRVLTLAVVVAIGGAIHAQEIPESPAGTATRGVLALRPSTNASGTGASGYVSKWIDNLGALGNSSIFDNGTSVGIGTTTPGAALDTVRTSTGDVMMRLINNGTTTASGSKLRYVAATGATSQLQLTDMREWLMAIAGNNTDGMQFRVTGVGGGGSEASLNGSTRMTITRTGRVGIGTTAPTAMLHVTGDVVVDGNIAAKYQDVAEWVPATTKIGAGSLVVLNDERPNEVMMSSTAYDTKVAGVVSDRPGLLLGEAADSKVAVATTGRVRIHVDASRRAIRVGDLLVASNIAGTAMASEPVDVGGVKMHRPGTIIGKALEPLSEGKGDILVLLTLQ